MGPPPVLGIATLGISGATFHAFAAALQGVVAVGVKSVLPSPSPTASAGRVSSLLLLHLRFACGVTGNTDLPHIWDEVAQLKGSTEGLATLSQAILRGLLSCWRFFWRRAHFSASLPLLEFLNNLSLMNPSLVHTSDDMPGYG